MFPVPIPIFKNVPVKKRALLKDTVKGTLTFLKWHNEGHLKIEKCK